MLGVGSVGYTIILQQTLTALLSCYCQQIQIGYASLLLPSFVPCDDWLFRCSLTGEWSLSHAVIRCGVLGLASLTMLCIVSLRPLRQLNYEFFFVVHFLLVLWVADHLCKSYRSAGLPSYCSILLLGGFFHTRRFRSVAPDSSYPVFTDRSLASRTISGLRFSYGASTVSCASSASLSSTTGTLGLSLASAPLTRPLRSPRRVSCACDYAAPATSAGLQASLRTSLCRQSRASRSRPIPSRLHAQTLTTMKLSARSVV